MKRMTGLMAAVLLATAVIATAQTTEDRLAKIENELAGLKKPGATGLGAAKIGGYGELHYNNLSGSGGASDKDEMDFHRFVLFVAYDFTDSIRFNAELEVEHSLAGDGKPGEVELEQAYVDFDISDSHTARAGLFLIPVGILNETHEPPTFYGVERNSVEKNIIPTTWWEAGAGLHGQLTDSISYGAYLHSGLNTSSNKSYAVRNGRQKVAEAAASDLAGTVAVKWSAPGVTVGGALQYQGDITQGTDADAGSAVLSEIHAELSKGALGLRALYAVWQLDGDGPKEIGADKQSGWYVEPSVKVSEDLGLFCRYSQWDNKAGASGSSEKVQYDLGANWWPHEQVVVKVDHQWQDNEDGKDQSGFNLGIGYNF